ncbi:copper amine oxidase N-terminal domain-containing protein [Natronincola ferrireducens]|uniref:Copper amine oxidase N-terminal domain-containing protein n=1 Tax=Natronincola ferrireducens TaxID=393762 RepID=A0A1G9GLT5_9FIRM|nr:copper amine oxidase N-terminal domain-containing protein [Natronincola ferrireducens]SDL01233.1 Copper amine oxidase N-terminal domain-containing protein [Natronincola ferrireducens]
MQKRMILSILLVFLLIFSTFTVYADNMVENSNRGDDLPIIIELTIGNTIAMINGEAITLDVPPFIGENNRTLVPLHFIAQALGCEVEWDSKTSTISIVDEYAVLVTMNVDSTIASVYGEEVELDTSPIIHVPSGHPMVPVNFISTTLGYTVGWNQETRRVSITGAPVDVVEPVSPEINQRFLGVVVGYNDIDSTVSMLINGGLTVYPTEEILFVDVVESWDHYSHWGLYEAGVDAEGIMVTIEYGEGVVDTVGIFADFYTDKTLADVLSVEGNTITLIGVEYFLDSDDPDDLPGFSTNVNENLTPANGENIQLANDVLVYVEGEDGLFVVGDVSMIQSNLYDYVEFYDVDGDLIYDIVIVWLI